MERPDLGAPDLRIHYIRVTNHHDMPFTDRWDGIPVSIGPGKSENLELDMANHFFGYFYGASEDAMFRHTCKRQGWNTPAHLKVGDSGKTLAQDLFGKIEIKPVIYKMVEVAPDLDEPIPADPELPKEAPTKDPPKAATDDLPALPPRKRGG